MRALILVASAALAVSACSDDNEERFDDVDNVTVIDEDADNGVGCDDPKTTDVIEHCP